MTCIPYIAKSFPSNDLSRCKSCLLPGPDDLIELASIGYPLLGLSVVESCRRLRAAEAGDPALPGGGAPRTGHPLRQAPRQNPLLPLRPPANRNRPTQRLT